MTCPHCQAIFHTAHEYADTLEIAKASGYRHFTKPSRVKCPECGEWVEKWVLFGVKKEVK